MPDTLGPLPFWYFKALALALGATFGSFGNVLIWRVPRNENLLRPGSHCPGCGRPVAWYDNVPVLSWLVLLGRCRSCRQPISLRYPLVELVCAVLSLASLYLAVGWSQGIGDPAGVGALWFFPFAFCFLLVVITFIDLEHWRIPPSLAGTGAALGVLGAIASGPLTGVSWSDSLIGMAVGGGALLLLAEFWILVLKREGMGYGDVFLLGMIGAQLGYKALPFVLLAASVQGLLVTVPYVLFGGRSTPPWEQQPPPADAGPAAADADAADAADAPPPAGDAASPRPISQVPIPFGPFLALGALEWLFFGDLVWSWLMP